MNGSDVRQHRRLAGGPRSCCGARERRRRPASLPAGGPQSRFGTVLLQAPGFVIRMVIRLYQLFVSPLLTPSCRYLPTCSEYAAEAVVRHGALRGAALGVRRLLRCHPWGGSGYDPVPEPGHPHR